MDADAILQTLKKDQSFEIEVDGDVITLLPKEVEVRTQPKEGYMVEEEQGIIVGVCTVVTKELKKEGLAREIVRRIQNQRKDAGFEIADQIEVYYEAGPRLCEVFITHGDYIASETLSISIRKAEFPEQAYVADYKMDGESLKIGLIRKSHT
jgi:isoleucyl-tRNA synthetase